MLFKHADESGYEQKVGSAWLSVGSLVGEVN